MDGPLFMAISIKSDKPKIGRFFSRIVIARQMGQGNLLVTVPTHSTCAFRHSWRHSKQKMWPQCKAGELNVLSNAAIRVGHEDLRVGWFMAQ